MAGKKPLKPIEFARQYFLLRNGEKAAIKAGYSPKAAKQQASRLLTKANVQKELARLQSLSEAKTLITKQRVLEEHARIAFSDPADVMSWSESGIDLIPSVDLPKEKRAIIKSLSQNVTGTGMSMKVEMHSKADALKEIAKLSGYYPETGTGEGVTVIRINNHAKEVRK